MALPFSGMSPAALLIWVPRGDAAEVILSFGSMVVEEVLDYRTLSCSKAKPYWKPYWDFPLKQGQKKDVKCIYQEGMSILDFLFPPCFNRKSQLGFQ